MQSVLASITDHHHLLRMRQGTLPKELALGTVSQLSRAFSNHHLKSVMINHGISSSVFNSWHF